MIKSTRIRVQLHVIFEDDVHPKTQGYVGQAVFETHLASLEDDGERWAVRFPFSACPISPLLIKRVTVVVNRLRLGRCTDVILDGSGKRAALLLSGDKTGKAAKNLTTLFVG